MSISVRVLAGLSALVLALAACGGDDDETTAAETAAGAEDVRLSASAWDEYVELRDDARAVNEKAITTFRACRQIIDPDVAPEQVQDCMGTATADVVAEGEKVMTHLEGLEGEVGGACATATTNLAGYIRLYTASVQALGTAVEQDNVAAMEGSIDDSLDVLGRSMAANVAFETACKPV